jgi:hypothetical protein
VENSNSVASKISASGRKVMMVPVAVVGSPLVSSVCGTPRAYSWSQVKPSRRTSISSFSDSALTTETPTPCRPPETL